MALRNTSNAKKIDSEKVVEAHLHSEAKKRGWMALKLLPTFVRGLPDRILLIEGGRMAFIELKTTKERAFKLQRIMHERLRALGFEVYLIDTVAQVNDLIEKYEHHTPA